MRTLQLAAAAVLLAGNALAQSDRLVGRVTGYIIGPLGDPVSAAEVWAQDWDGKELVRTRADGEGFFLYEVVD